MDSPIHPARKPTLTTSRLRKHADYQRAYAVSRKRQSPLMSWFLALHAAQDGPPPASSRVGLTVGRVIGKAHERNRIKRRLRALLQRHIEKLPAGCDLILHPRRTVLVAESSRLESELLRVLEQACREAAQAPAARQR